MAAKKPLDKIYMQRKSEKHRGKSDQSSFSIVKNFDA